jgi:hypothetical protein
MIGIAEATNEMSSKPATWTSRIPSPNPISPTIIFVKTVRIVTIGIWTPPQLAVRDLQPTGLYRVSARSGEIHELILKRFRGYFLVAARLSALRRGPLGSVAAADLVG